MKKLNNKPKNGLFEKVDVNEWRNDIIARGSQILSGLRLEEKFDLMRMSIDMLKMQVQNDRRFNDGMEAPCSYLWESHLSILGMMVSMIFPRKMNEFQSIFKKNNQKNPEITSAPKKIYNILLDLEKNDVEIEEASVVSDAMKQGINELKIREIIDKMANSGIICRPRAGKIKILH